MKTCKKCNTPKELELFVPNNRCTDGHTHECLECKKLRNRKDWHNRPVAQRKAKRQKQALTNYTLTPEQYADKDESQNGVCDICKRKCPTGKKLAVDHDHSCCPYGKSCGRCVRGLLCTMCNRGIGNLQDSLAVILSAAAYVQKWGAA